MSGNPIFTYWYFHLPNFVLAALMYTMLGRFILSFAFPADSQNYIWRAFVTLTDPVLRVLRLITPAAVPYMVALIFGFLWLMLARVAWFAILAAAGKLPTVSG
jgi:YggT family protein